MSELDPTWVAFDPDRNSVPLADPGAVRGYLARVGRALGGLARVLDGRPGEAAVAGYLARLRGTLGLLGERFRYSDDSDPLKIDTTDSGFVHFSVLRGLAADLATRGEALRRIRPEPELKRAMATAITRFQAPVRDLQLELSRRRYLDALAGDRLFAGFMPGRMRPAGGGASPGAEAGRGATADAPARWAWSFATYDPALNRPAVYELFFERDGAPGEWDPATGPRYLSLEAEARRLASGARGLLSFANDLDEALVGVRPKLVRRTTLGPFEAPGVTALEGVAGELMAAEAARGPFVLGWQRETLISDREAEVGGSLFARPRRRQIFWVPREPGLASRGVSRDVRGTLVPHWFGQILAERNVFPGHERFVIDERDEVYGVS